VSNFPKTHVFVCTNTRQSGQSCGPQGGAALRDTLKARCKAHPDLKAVRINAAACLGQCERGVAAVIYPAGEWHLDLKPEANTHTVNGISACDQLMERVRTLHAKSSGTPSS
jgi:predicted metal-binding protein